MKKTKFTESQIVKALRENEQGRSVGDISREQGIDKSIFYYWRKKYGGMEQQQLNRLKELEEDNNWLKQMYADVSLDNKKVKGRFVKKVPRPSDKRVRAKYLIKQYTVPILRACKLVDLSRSMWYYHSRRDDSEVIDKPTELAESYPIRSFIEY